MAKHQPDPAPDGLTSTVLAERHVGVERQALTAALEEFEAKGVKGLTIEGVAARSGLAKTTLYRRWRSKEDLALAVLLEMARLATGTPATGDVRTAVTDYMTAVVRILRETLMGPMMRGLASDVATDERMAAAFQREVIALRQAHLASLVRAPDGSSRLREGVDAALLQELLFGPIYYRLLFSGGPLEDDLAARVVAAVLPGVLVSER
ncbi:MAG: TetR/AcrR family transcriptional regulator [Marmoricola sp.]